MLNFPSNPTGQCVELSFFEKIVEMAKEAGIWVVHDLAYADLCFDGYVAPSILQVPGARDIAGVPRTPKLAPNSNCSAIGAFLHRL